MKVECMQFHVLHSLIFAAPPNGAAVAWLATSVQLRLPAGGQPNKKRLAAFPAQAFKTIGAKKVVRQKSRLNPPPVHDAHGDCRPGDGHADAGGDAEKPSSIVVSSGAFWNGNEWVHPLKDPVFPTSRGGFCPALAKSITDATKRKVYIVNVAVSASSSNAAYVENYRKSWSAYGRLRERAVTTYRNAVAKLNGPFELGGVIWMQGEQEAKYYAKGFISLEDARQGFEDVFKWLTDSFERVFVVGIGYRNGTDRYDFAHESINRLLKQTAGRVPHCYFASNMPIRFKSLGLMQKPVNRQNPHYLIRGYDLLGEDIGKYVARYFMARQR